MKILTFFFSLLFLGSTYASIILDYNGQDYLNIKEGEISIINLMDDLKEGEHTTVPLAFEVNSTFHFLVGLKINGIFGWGPTEKDFWRMEYEINTENEPTNFLVRNFEGNNDEFIIEKIAVFEKDTDISELKNDYNFYAMNIKDIDVANQEVQIYSDGNATAFLGSGLSGWWKLNNQPKNTIPEPSTSFLIMFSVLLLMFSRRKF